MRGPAFLLLLVLCLLSSPALAASIAPPAGAHFARFGPGTGGIAIAADPGSGTLYASFDIGGVFRSADGGLSWTWAGQGLGKRLIGGIAVGPSGEVYAAARSDSRTQSGDRVQAIEVLGSSDRGANWSLRGSFEYAGTFLQTGALVPGGEPGTLYLALERELWKSPDGGRSWSRVLETKGGISAVAAGPREIWVGTTAPGPVLRWSADGGTAWTEIPSFPWSVVTGLAIAPGAAQRPPKIYAGSGRGGLYESMDGGATWRLSDRSASTLELVDVAVDAADPGTVVAIYRPSRFAPFQVRISRNGGATWQPGGPLMAGKTARWGADLLMVGGTVYATGGTDLAASTDRGATWAYRLRGAGGGGQGLGGIRFAVENGRVRTYALVGLRAFQSEDHGRTWTSFATAVLSGEEDRLRDLAFDPDRPSIVYAAGDHGLFKSWDGGEHWQPAGPAAHHLAALPGGTVLAGGCGLARSPDGGVTWKPVLSCEAEGGARRQVEKLLPDPAAPNTVFAAIQETRELRSSVWQILRSRDGGRTWRSILTGTGVMAVSPQPPAVLYAVQGDLLLASRDGGDSFREVGPVGLFLATDLLVDRKDPKTFYLSTRWKGLLRSTDGGATWSALGAGAAAPAETPSSDSLFQLAADPWAPDVLYAGVMGWGVLVQIELRTKPAARRGR